MDELLDELALFDDVETRWWEFDDLPEIEQFDQTVADDFNMDFSEVVL